MDFKVSYWSETHHEVKVKYLTSVMFGHSKTKDIVKEMLDVLEKLAMPIKLVISLGMDGPNVSKSIMEKLKQVKREKVFQLLVKCPSGCLIHVCHSSFQKGLAIMDTMLKSFVSICITSSRKAHAEERIYLKVKNLWVWMSWLYCIMCRIVGCHFYLL